MMNTRVLQSVGGYSVSITLPPQWVRKVGLRPGSAVIIEEKGDELVLRRGDAE